GEDSAAVALDDQVAHAAFANLAIVVAGVGGTEPDEDELFLTSVDRAMRPVRRDEGADARSHHDGPRFAVARFEEGQPLAGLRVVGFAAIPPLMVVAACHVVLGADLAGRHDGGAEAEVAFRLAVVDDFINEGIAALGDRPLLRRPILEQTAELAEALQV